MLWDYASHISGIYKATHTHKRLYMVLPKYAQIQALPGMTSCRLMKYNNQAIEFNDLLMAWHRQMFIWTN